MNLPDLIPGARDLVFLLVGVFVGAFLLLLGALMSAAGTADDHDERAREQAASSGGMAWPHPWRPGRPRRLRPVQRAGGCQ